MIGVVIEMPWPEAPERVERRVRGLVASVVRADELEGVRLEWVTPYAHRLDDADAGWVALRLTVSTVTDDCFQQEIWPTGTYEEWEDRLLRLASDLEDWACESTFGWGQLRYAVAPRTDGCRRSGTTSGG